MSCFTCSACSTAFDDVYWEHEGKALCEKHYLQVKKDPSLSLVCVCVCVSWYDGGGGLTALRCAQTAGKECVKCSELISGPLVKYVCAPLYNGTVGKERQLTSSYSRVGGA
jgi:hypothetical protein